VKWEIKKLFEIHPGRYSVCGLNLIERMWWRFMPGDIISVRWPSGNIVVNHEDPRWCDLGGAVWVDLGFSADPNDHYRPWLEQNVGRQGWDWNWGMANNDAAENRLTIKICKSKCQWAIVAALMWS